MSREALDFLVSLGFYFPRDRPLGLIVQQQALTVSMREIAQNPTVDEIKNLIIARLRNLEASVINQVQDQIDKVRRGERLTTEYKYEIDPDDGSN